MRNGLASHRASRPRREYISKSILSLLKYNAPAISDLSMNVSIIELVFISNDILQKIPKLSSNASTLKPNFHL